MSFPEYTIQLLLSRQKYTITPAWQKVADMNGNCCLVKRRAQLSSKSGFCQKSMRDRQNRPADGMITKLSAKAYNSSSTTSPLS